MEKEHVVTHLRNAKSAHISWLQKAKLLINGVDVNEEAVPVDSTECNFGKWFYGEGQKLNALSNNPPECMQNIERLHFQLHDTYLTIFNIYFNKPKSGFFAKIFGTKKATLTPEELTLAKMNYEKMEGISHQLIDEINRLERRLIAIPDDRLKKLI